MLDIMGTAQTKEIFTTGDVARICHVAPRTVSKWFDTGKLRGYRIPGSRDRRIPREQLVAFMRAHGIPMDGLDLGMCRLLVVGDEFSPQLAETLNASSQYELRGAANEFEAGVAAQQFRPHVIVLSVNSDIGEAVKVCTNIKATAALQAARVIAACENVSESTRGLLLAQGCDEVVPNPCTAAELIRAVERVTNLIT